MSSTELSVAGRLSEKEVRRALERRRNDVIGPTTIYYAGVTAPVISAAMALLTKTAFQKAGLAEVWTYLISSIVAAFAGITWYLIFMRWARRQRYGRGGELETETRITLAQGAIEVQRGGVRVHIPAEAMESVHVRHDHAVIGVNGMSDVVIPLRWFDDPQQRKAFVAALKAMRRQP